MIEDADAKKPSGYCLQESFHVHPSSYELELQDAWCESLLIIFECRWLDDEKDMIPDPKGDSNITQCIALVKDLQ
jgi:hypothetical protein